MSSVVGKGLDLYNGDATPNWVDVKTAGMGNIVHKLTEGITYKDAQAVARLRATWAAGLNIAGYHFLHPHDDAQAQLINCLSVANQIDPHLPIWIDFETTDGLDATSCANACAEFARLLGARCAGIYTYPDFINWNVPAAAQLAAWPLWIAGASGAPVGPWTSVAGHQLTGQLWNGIDADDWYTLAGFLRQNPTPAPAPKPAPAPTPKPVSPLPPGATMVILGMGADCALATVPAHLAVSALFTRIPAVAQQAVAAGDKVIAVGGQAVDAMGWQTWAPPGSASVSKGNLTACNGIHAQQSLAMLVAVLTA